MGRSWKGPNKKIKRIQQEKKDNVEDGFSRINFLYQAARLYSADAKTVPLSRFYASTFKQVSSRLVIRLYPTLPLDVVFLECIRDFCCWSAMHSSRVCRLLLDAFHLVSLAPVLSLRSAICGFSCALC